MLSQHSDTRASRSCLITHLLSTLRGAEGTPNPDVDSVDTYRVKLRGISGDTAFRLRAITPRPPSAARRPPV